MSEQLATYVIWTVQGFAVLFVFSILCALLIYPLRNKNLWVGFTVALILFCLLSLGIGYLLNN